MNRYNHWEKSPSVRKNVKTLLFLLPILYMIGATVIKYNNPGAYKRYFWKEDSFFQDLTALDYFLASLISFIIAGHHRKSSSGLNSFIGWMYLVLTLGLFFIGMEEISWGQRIFGIKTFKWFEHHNYQHEISLHNLSWVPLHLSFIVVGIYGAFGRTAIPKQTKEKYASIVDLFFPRFYLFFYFFSVAAIYIYYEYLSQLLVNLFGNRFAWGHGHFMSGYDQEAPEFLLSAGFLLFVGINWIKTCDKVWPFNRKALGCKRHFEDAAKQGSDGQ